MSKFERIFEHRKKSQPAVVGLPIYETEESNEYAQQLNNLLSEEAQKAISALEYITEHLRRDNKHKKVGFIFYLFFLIKDSRGMEVCINGD